MRKLWIPVATICGLSLAACESKPKSPTVTPHRPVHAGQACHPRTPPAAGDCIAQHFGVKRSTGRVQAGGLCEDWSVWQGYYPSMRGLRCVIIQSNYGLHVEPSVWSQVRDAHAHGVPCGLYTFMEGAPGSAEAILAVSIYRRTGCTLGVWADAEVSSAYSHACAYTATAKSAGVLAGLYSSPGLWPGGRCQGYLWPAEWGNGPYPFGGYPRAAIVLHQFCGTCGVDLDRDLGLIALGHHESPAERRARKTKRAHALERAIRRDRRAIHSLHAALAGHHCYVKRGHRAKGGRCAKWKRAGDRAHRAGARHHRELDRLHREGIR